MKHLKRPSPEEELAIYRRLLINLHTARWTGNRLKVDDLLDKIGAYSYARTNSNGDFEQEEQDMIKTLLSLDG
jgi:hypothetical protein